jgi:hypothetical protein
MLAEFSAVFVLLVVLFNNAIPNRDMGGFPPQLILGCRWCALLLTRSVNTQPALCGAGRRLVAVAGRLVVEVG